MKTPTEYFELFLDIEMIDMSVKYYNLYAASKGVNLELTVGECRCFFGNNFPEWLRLCSETVYVLGAKTRYALLSSQWCNET